MHVSAGHFTGTVIRAAQIHLKAPNGHAKLQECEMQGQKARAVQHQIPSG